MMQKKTDVVVLTCCQRLLPEETSFPYRYKAGCVKLLYLTCSQVRWKIPSKIAWSSSKSKGSEGGAMSSRDDISGSREKATGSICTTVSEQTPNTHTITQARGIIRSTAV